jgi:hypothetical protein
MKVISGLSHWSESAKHNKKKEAYPQHLEWGPIGQLLGASQPQQPPVWRSQTLDICSITNTPIKYCSTAVQPLNDEVPKTCTITPVLHFPDQTLLQDIQVDSHNQTRYMSSHRYCTVWRSKILSKHTCSFSFLPITKSLLFLSMIADVIWFLLYNLQ